MKFYAANLVPNMAQNLYFKAMFVNAIVIRVRNCPKQGVAVAGHASYGVIAPKINRATKQRCFAECPMPLFRGFLLGLGMLNPPSN